MQQNLIQKNPYIIGRPITETELFFGREWLFEFIKDNLESQQKLILLYGQRRIGKSSVLSQIPKFVNENKYAFVLFDLQDKAQLSLNDVLYSLATEIIESLQLSLDNINLPSDEEWKTDRNIFSQRFLPLVYQELGDKNLVLLLDEFDVLSNEEPNSAVQEFFPYLTRLKQPQKLFLITVLGRKLDDMPKLLSMFKDAAKEEIGLLDEQSAMQLITSPVRDVLEYDPDAIQAILELSSGHPYFTQIICFVIFMRARNEQKRQVTRADVENIVEQAIEIGEAGLVWFRAGLPIPERVLFSAAAELQKPDFLGSKLAAKKPITLLKEYGVVETKLLSKAEKQLVDWNFLQKVDRSKLPNSRGYIYKLTIEFVRRWLLKQYSLTEVIYQLEEVDVEANHLYEDATESYQQNKVANAIQLYEQVLKINPNHFNALYMLGEAYLDVKEYSKAIECCERCYKVDPVRHQDGLVEARLSYGEYLILQKQFNLAQQQFNLVLAIEPDNKRAKQQLTKVAEEIRKALKSPYVVGTFVGPEEFLGRIDEVYIAFNQILNSSNWVFYGSPGIGKTSFLKYLAAPETWQSRSMNTDHEYLVVYLNCESIHNFTPSSFWQQVLSELQDILTQLKLKHQNEPSDTSNIEHIDFLQAKIHIVLQQEIVVKEDMKQILRQIKEQDKFLVLLLDNYNAIFEQKNNDNEAEILKFLREFRNLAEHESDRRLSSIMTSSKPLSEVASGSTHNDLPYICQPLKTFKDTEIVTLWNRMPDSWKHREDLRNTVQKISGGYPALIQMVCFLFYDICRQDKTPILETVESQFEGISEQIIRGIWQSLNPVQKMLLRLIALSYVGGKIEKRSYSVNDIEDLLKDQKYVREVKNLEERGIILGTVEQNKKIYSFTASAMQQWVIREIVNNSEAEVTEREKVFLMMNKKHVNQIKNAMQWIGENMEFVKSIAGGIQEIVKLLML